jgi:hypothetical protein
MDHVIAGPSAVLTEEYFSHMLIGFQDSIKFRPGTLTYAMSFRACVLLN